MFFRPLSRLCGQVGCSGQPLLFDKDLGVSMRILFPRTYDMIFELDRLEGLMPYYSEPLMILSKAIRRTIWNLSNEKRLAATLYGCNLVFGTLIKIYGEHIEFLEMYVDYLDRHSNTYANRSLTNIYNSVRANIAIFKTQDLIKEHWKQINPYFKKEYSKEDLFSKDLTALLDDFFNNIVIVCPEQFLFPLDCDKFNHLLRGRRKEWHSKSDLCAPSIEIAKANNIINRWNPPDKRYLYLVAGKGTPDDIETVCQEMRIKPGETLTIANFEVCDAAKKSMIIDLDYENISRQDIFDFAEKANKKQVSKIINQITESGITPSEEYIRHQINISESKTKWLASAFVGKLLLKEICEAIFVPLDENEDNDNNEKDKCYKAFHILAEYFENKGYAGICYPSTRMKLIKKKGSNLVLFDADSAEPILSTFRLLKYK